MARTLKDFLGIHSGRTAWIFGKGPSLDSFDMNDAGAIRCAINDVVRYVPNCTYCFSNDAVNAWSHLYKPEHVLFQPARVYSDGFLKAEVPPAAELVTYPDIHDDSRLAWSREMLATEGLTIRRGTLGSALQILHIMGVAEIVCVGIDGGGSHANKQFFTRLRNDHAQDYNAIREAFILAAKILGIRVQFWGLPQEARPNGFMLIKITEPCFVRGVAYSPGEIIECLPSDATILIGCQRGVEWTKPAEPVIERAVLAPAPETTVAAPSRKTRKK